MTASPKIWSSVMIWSGWRSRKSEQLLKHVIPPASTNTLNSDILDFFIILSFLFVYPRTLKLHIQAKVEYAHGRIAQAVVLVSLGIDAHEVRPRQQVLPREIYPNTGNRKRLEDMRRQGVAEIHVTQLDVTDI